MGCEDVWERAGRTVSPQNPEGMEAGCLLSKDRGLFLILLPFHPFIFFRPLKAFFLVKSCFECNVSERRPNLGGLDKVGDGKVVDCEGVGGRLLKKKEKKRNSTSGQEKDSNCTSLKCTGLRVCRLMSVVPRVNRITEGW